MQMRGCTGGWCAGVCLVEQGKRTRVESTAGKQWGKRRRGKIVEPADWWKELLSAFPFDADPRALLLLQRLQAFTRHVKRRSLISPPKSCRHRHLSLSLDSTQSPTPTHPPTVALSLTATMASGMCPMSLPCSRFLLTLDPDSRFSFLSSINVLLL